MRFLPLTICVLLLPTTSCIAQDEPCALRTMTETVAPIYPALAKAAHFEGDIIMLATFKTSGEVEKIEVVGGPEPSETVPYHIRKMLEDAATHYVKGWRANPYTGPRTCPIVIHFHLLPEHDYKTPPVVRQDLQHVTLNAPAAHIDMNHAYVTPGRQVIPSSINTASRVLLNPANSPRHLTISKQQTSASKASSLPNAFAITPRDKPAYSASDFRLSNK